jgi:hypothetical protein
MHIKGGSACEYPHIISYGMTSIDVQSLYAELMTAISDCNFFFLFSIEDQAVTPVLQWGSTYATDNPNTHRRASQKKDCIYMKNKTFLI